MMPGEPGPRVGPLSLLPRRDRIYSGRVTRLERAEWECRETAHAQRVDALTADHRVRRPAGVKHPVEDFLHQYYNHPVARLRRWHPGPGVVLAGAACLPRASWTHYAVRGRDVSLDVAGFVAARGRTIDFVRGLLTATLSRLGSFGCFGLHEWAMVYRLSQEEVRHAAYPLRLSPSEIDSVVESHEIRCSHFDAYRFFTPAAVPRNRLRPTRETQESNEQPGCLHAGMDVYKWCFKLAPAVPSELTADAFALAHEIRRVDMRASPYDVSLLGEEPIAIETAEGKAEFARLQRAFAARGQALRTRLLDGLDRLVAVGTRSPAD